MSNKEDYDSPAVTDIKEEETSRDNEIKDLSNEDKTEDVKTEENTEVSEQDEDEFEVDFLLKKKLSNKKTFYLVRWKGFGKEDDTWEPEANLQETASEALEEYKKKEKEEAEKKKQKTKSPSKKRSVTVEKEYMDSDSDEEPLSLKKKRASTESDDTYETSTKKKKSNARSKKKSTTPDTVKPVVSKPPIKVTLKVHPALNWLASDDSDSDIDEESKKKAEEKKKKEDDQRAKEMAAQEKREEERQARETKEEEARKVCESAEIIDHRDEPRKSSPRLPFKEKEKRRAEKERKKEEKLQMKAAELEATVESSLSERTDPHSSHIPPNTNGVLDNNVESGHQQDISPLSMVTNVRKSLAGRIVVVMVNNSVEQDFTIDEAFQMNPRGLLQYFISRHSF